MKSKTSQDNALLLAALGVLAYAASMMTHEALGHGGYCLAAGGHNTSLTAFWETCCFPGAARLGIKAAGPAAQFGAGLLAWLGLHRLAPAVTRLRWVLWLYMTFDLLICSGYVAFSGGINAGDAAELVAPLRAPLVWRSGVILLGSVAYFLSMRVAAYELKRFAGADESMQRLFRLVWIPYVSAGVLACCTAAIIQFMGPGAAGGLAIASPGLHRMLGPMGMAAASSFGAGAGMFGLPAMERGIRAADSLPTLYLQWSTPWAVLAGAVIFLFLGYLGTGLK